MIGFILLGFLIYFLLAEYTYQYLSYDETWIHLNKEQLAKKYSHGDFLMSIFPLFVISFPYLIIRYSIHVSPCYYNEDGEVVRE